MNTKQITIKISPAVLEALEKAAKFTGVSSAEKAAMYVLTEWAKGKQRAQ